MLSDILTEEEKEQINNKRGNIKCNEYLKKLKNNYITYKLNYFHILNVLRLEIKF